MIGALAQHADKLKYLVNENSTTILSAVGVVGTVTTAVLTGRATFKAAEIILMNTDHEAEDKELSTPDKVALVWKQYIPPVVSGVLTIGCIITAHRISSSKIAALTVAAGVSERALQEYKDKVVEKLGPKQSTDIRDEIAQENVTKNPPSGEVVVLGTGKVLCKDELTGRYFQSSMEEIRRAENNINRELINHMSTSLSSFYDEIGLEPTTYTDSVGWHIGTPMVVKITTTLTPDNQPCLSIGFERNPVHDYSSHWDN